MDMSEVNRWQDYVKIRDEHIKELSESLSLLLTAYDALLPGARYIVVDIGLLNEAAMKARPLVEEYERTRKAESKQ